MKRDTSNSYSLPRRGARHAPSNVVLRSPLGRFDVIDRKTEDSQQRQTGDTDMRLHYEAPQLLKKRSVARVTLFSGSGASGASGLTSS
jgi:hypothetical protein